MSATYVEFFFFPSGFQFFCSSQFFLGASPLFFALRGPSSNFPPLFSLFLFPLPSPLSQTNKKKPPASTHRTLHLLKVRLLQRQPPHLFAGFPRRAGHGLGRGVLARHQARHAAPQRDHARARSASPRRRPRGPGLGLRVPQGVRQRKPPLGVGVVDLDGLPGRSSSGCRRAASPFPSTMFSQAATMTWTHRSERF